MARTTVIEGDYPRFMKTKFHFSRLDMALLIANAVAFGGYVILLMLGRASGPLVLLTVGAFGMLLGKLGRAYYRGRQSESSLTAAERHLICNFTSPMRCSGIAPQLQSARFMAADAEFGALAA
jgi:hypothetical protein